MATGTNTPVLGQDQPGQVLGTTQVRIRERAAWQVEQFIGHLPGDTELRASGQLGVENDQPAFRGDVSVASTRLDALAALWRKPKEDTPLFNVPGTLTGRVMLVGEALGLNDGVLTVEGQSHGVEIRLGFGDEKRLDLVGNFTALDGNGSARIAALLPDMANDPAFGVSFPVGSFTLTGKQARFSIDPRKL